MDEPDIEKGYANFHRRLNHILRERDVRQFRARIAGHPGQAVRPTRCLGLSDESAEAETVKAILMRSALKDLHREGSDRLKQRRIQAPAPGPKRTGGKEKRP